MASEVSFKTGTRPGPGSTGLAYFRESRKSVETDFLCKTSGKIFFRKPIAIGTAEMKKNAVQLFSRADFWTPMFSKRSLPMR